MAHRVEIVVGSHNVTGERQMESIIDIVSTYVPSFSCWIGFGVWQGTPEKSTKIEAFCIDTDWIEPCVKEILESLDQDAVEVIVDGQEQLYWR
ncbi:MAG: hypothetical protein QGF00_25395 [Planctomycetota bacterium]|jgi:hypothetical protein|nr:hypothetical protein [Planctomycetota bacterium]MDP7252964.1 hypothetical protein [Planctomycetota bacterium]|tara:strand:- start:177 stop:455 length:279 start_codon:yes stop_codon:yes gene_type:complete